MWIVLTIILLVAVALLTVSVACFIHEYYVAGCATGIVSCWLFYKTKIWTTLIFPALLSIAGFFHYHWRTILVYALSYIALGLAYSMVKWFLQVRDICRKYPADEEIPDRIVAQDLNPSRHKGTLTYWILLWPFSLLGTIVGEWPKRFGQFLVEQFRGFYIVITRMALRSVGRTYRP